MVGISNEWTTSYRSDSESVKKTNRVDYSFSREITQPVCIHRVFSVYYLVTEYRMHLTERARFTDCAENVICTKSPTINHCYETCARITFFFLSKNWSVAIHKISWTIVYIQSSSVYLHAKSHLFKPQIVERKSISWTFFINEQYIRTY